MPPNVNTTTKLRNNPAAELVEDISFDGTAGAVFELPTWGTASCPGNARAVAGTHQPFRRPAKPEN
jgi:hypothetical protein